MNPISATLTRCRHGQPLVELTSEPFNGLEIRPKDLRHMAQQLLALTETATRLPTGGKHFAPTRVVLGEARQVPMPIATPAPLPSQPKPTHCTFCSTPASEAGYLVAGPGVAICSGCIKCATGIVAEQPFRTGGQS